MQEVKGYSISAGAAADRSRGSGSTRRSAPNAPTRRRQRRSQPAIVTVLQRALQSACRSKAGFWVVTGCATVLWGAVQLEKLQQLRESKAAAAHIEEQLCTISRQQAEVDNGLPARAELAASPADANPLAGGDTAVHPLQQPMPEAAPLQSQQQSPSTPPPAPHGSSLRSLPGTTSTPHLSSRLTPSRSLEAAVPNAHSVPMASGGDQPQAPHIVGPSVTPHAPAALSPMPLPSSAQSAASPGVHTAHAATPQHSARDDAAPTQLPTAPDAAAVATTDASTRPEPAAATPPPLVRAADGSSRSSTGASTLSHATGVPAAAPGRSESSRVVAVLGGERLVQDLAALEEQQQALYPLTSYNKPLGHTGVVRQQLGHASKYRRKVHHMYNKRGMVRRAPLGVAQVNGEQQGAARETVLVTKYRTLQHQSAEKQLVRAQDTKYGEVVRQLDKEEKQQRAGPPLRFKSKEARQWQHVVLKTPQDLTQVLADALQNGKKVFQKRRVGEQTIFTWIAG